MGVKLSKGLSARIKRLVTERPARGQSDRLLIAAVWYEEAKAQGADPFKISGTYLLHLFTEGKLSHTESIRRTRAKIQENEPELFEVPEATTEARRENEEEIRTVINENDRF